MKKFLLVLLSLVSLTCFLTACDENKNEVCSHSYSEWIIVDEATCLEDGLKSHTCSKCGDVETQIVEAFGHTEVVDARVEPTCTFSGLTEGKHCSSCNTILINQETIEKLEHIEVTHEAKEPTCINVGWNKYVSCERENCNYSTYNEIAANGHTVLKHEAKAPTCTNIGWTEYVSCEIEGCNYSTYNEIPAPGHTVVIDNAITPTCTKTGLTEGKHCSVCDFIIKPQTLISANGHTYNQKKVNDNYLKKAATCINEAIYYYSCSCGEVGDKTFELSGFKQHCFIDNQPCNICNATYGLEYELNGSYYSVEGIGSSQDYNIIIPKTYNGKLVTNIGYCAFWECKNLISVQIPDSIKTIEGFAFFSCESLVDIVIPDSVTVLGWRAFSSCSNLKNVTLSKNITVINEAFTWCTSLTTITLPEGITTIKDESFRQCKSLTSITIPSSVTNIGINVFMYCNKLANITVNENNPIYKSIDGDLYSKDGKTLIRYSVAKSATLFSIPDSVITVKDGAFHCSKIKEIVIGKNTKFISYGAFDGSSQLSKIYYSGTESEWNNIVVAAENAEILSAKVFCYSEKTPLTEGQYWHYVNGVPTVW